MSVATMALQSVRIHETAAGASRVPVQNPKSRRASVVIKETEMLLSGLQSDNDRSAALMVELEALLAASHQASASMACPRNSEESEPAPCSITSVQPLQEDGMEGAEAAFSPTLDNAWKNLAGTDNEPNRETDYGDKDPSEPQTETPYPPVGPKPVSISVARRRSSVVTFDGSVLHNGHPTAPISGAMPTAVRAPSFGSRYRPSSLQYNKSFSEGRTVGAMARPSQTEMGTAVLGFPPYLHSPTPLGPGAVPGGGLPVNNLAQASRRSSLSNEIVDCVSVRHGSAVPHYNNFAIGQLRTGVVQSDNEEEEEEEEEEGGAGTVSASSGHLQIRGAGAAECGGGSTDQSGLRTRASHGAPTGRFMRLIKGFFKGPQAKHHNNSSPTAQAPSATAGPPSPDPNCPSPTPFETALATGALSSMTLIPGNIGATAQATRASHSTSNSQRQMLTRGPSGRAFATAGPRASMELQRSLSRPSAVLTSSGRAVSMTAASMQQLVLPSSGAASPGGQVSGNTAASPVGPSRIILSASNVWPLAGGVTGSAVPQLDGSRPVLMSNVSGASRRSLNMVMQPGVSLPQL